MGWTWNALVGRSTFRTSKLKILLKLTLSRLAILKNKRRCRCSYAQSDIAQLVSFGYRDEAINRAEHVIKEQNMLAVFDMVESYCNFLIDRLPILQSSKVCPEELEDVISSLIYASSRIGELPELLDVRSMFAARYGRDFVSTAVRSSKDLQTIQLISAMELTSGNKRNVVRVIAEEKGLTFDAADSASSSEVPSSSRESSSTPPSRDSSPNPSLPFTDPMTAALAASYAAAYAASAARTAVTLSKRGKEIVSDDDDGDDHGGGSSIRGELLQERLRKVTEEEDNSNIRSGDSLKTGRSPPLSVGTRRPRSVR